MRKGAISKVVKMVKPIRDNDQYIIPEGSSDWNSWWELLRSEWFNAEGDVARPFDEIYDPIPELSEDA
jgi:hypothetical protein